MSSAATTKPKNQVRIGGQRSKYIHADQVKSLLAGGEPTVAVIAYSASISDAIAVVEMLRGQKMVKVQKIATGTGDNGNEYIEMTVEKDVDFDRLYDKQQEEREAKKASA